MTLAQLVWLVSVNPHHLGTGHLRHQIDKMYSKEHKLVAYAGFPISSIQVFGPNNNNKC
uniref:Uncharacterized protein n=1 Tax=Arundo donax TaxID=35708 RepID=A0A0A9API9_ARUDO